MVAAVGVNNPLPVRGLIPALFLCTVFVPNVSKAEDTQVMINACANSDFAQRNYDLCEIFYQNFKKNDYPDKIKKLIELHEKLKSCAITDKKCFEGVVIEMRELDIND